MRLVVAADGIRSTTRALVFGADEVTIRDLGLEMADLTVPRRSDDVDRWLWSSGVGGRAVTLRPDRHGATRAVLAVTPRRTESSGSTAERRTPDERRRHLRARFTDAGGQADRVVAGELAAQVHHRAAFAAYGGIMRPYVAQAQDLQPGTARLANPTSRLGIAAFHAGLRLAARGAVKTLAGRVFSPPAEAIGLPDYAHLTSSDTTGPIAER